MSQEQEILNYLKTGQTLSPLEALNRFGCMRLASRVYDLRNQGHRIEATRVGNGRKAWHEYNLKDIGK